MFYCVKCAERNKWPDSMFTSFGPCEICHKVAVCYDTPSYALPTPKRKKNTKKKKSSLSIFFGISMIW